MPSRNRPSQTHTHAKAASTTRKRPASQAPAQAQSPAAVTTTPPNYAESLPVVNRHAAGIDVGAASHWVCVAATPDGSDHVREFSAFTQGLQDIVTWLQACEVTTVAMESTGIYGVPLYERLESEGFAVLLVDPSYTKPVKGRPKTDRRDCQWIQRLHAHGLLAASFRPEAHEPPERQGIVGEEASVSEALCHPERAGVYAAGMEGTSRA